MQLINRLTYSYPVATTILLVLIAVFFSQGAAEILAAAYPDIERSAFSVFTRITTAAFITFLLWKLKALSCAGISTPKREWGSQWPLALLPLLLVGCLNFTGVQWNQLEFSLSRVPFWLTENLATGLFEETMMRAMAFYLLYRVWRDQRHGLLKAAIVQAMIFGALHLINLLNGFSLVVLIQVVYATMLGLAFAGLVAYTRSIWPAVFAHGFINAIGGINRTFIPDYPGSDASPAVYALLVTAIFILAVLPGLYMIKACVARSSLAPVE